MDINEKESKIMPEILYERIDGNLYKYKKIDENLYINTKTKLYFTVDNFFYILATTFKLTPNLTNLIEEGDYINGKKILAILETEIPEYGKSKLFVYNFNEIEFFTEYDNFEEILTHENYEKFLFKVRG